MNKGYIVDFVRKTITITAEFEKAMRSPDDDAYKTIRKLCADFPRYADCQAHAPHAFPLRQQTGRCFQMQSLQEPGLCAHGAVPLCAPQQHSVSQAV